MISVPAELLRKAIPPKAIPPIGWACSAALFYHFVIRDLGEWVLAFVAPGTVLPAVPIAALVTLLLVLLGLGGHRTWQKMKGPTK